MSMRYLIRRPNPEEISSIKVSDLSAQLGTPAANMRRHIKVIQSASRSLYYTFYSRKTDKGFVWVCPSLELVAESESDLREMAKEANVQSLPHLGR